MASAEAAWIIAEYIAHSLVHKGTKLEDQVRAFVEKVDYEGKMLGLKVTKDNLLETFWYASLALNSYLTIERELLTPEYD